MKEKNLPIVLFVCMGILFVLMYGVFELGGFGMETWEKEFCIAIIIAVAAFTCIAIWKTPISCKSANIYFNETSLPSDVEKIFVLKENLKSETSKEEKEIDADAIIYLDEECLRSFSILENLKYIYFACADPKIEKSFYETLVKNNVRIILYNGNKLEIVDDKNKRCSIEFYLCKQNDASNKIDVSGNINIFTKINKYKE